MNNRRKYSDQEKADALAVLSANKGNISATSRQVGIPIKTIDDWSKSKHGIVPAIAELRAHSEKSLADKFEEVAHLYIARALEKAAIKKTSGYYAVKAANEGAVTANLLRGLPTAITADISNPAERASKSVNMIEQWKARKAKTGTDG